MRLSAHDWGDRVEIGNGVFVHVEPVHHWSARGARDRRMALWAGFVIETPAGKIYFAGDTGFHDGINYRLMAEKHGGFRFAILPIGAYEPRWFMAPQHQNPEEAVQGMKLCNAAYRRRLPLGHLPAHRRTDRRAGPETGRGAGRSRHPAGALSRLAARRGLGRAGAWRPEPELAPQPAGTQARQRVFMRFQICRLGSHSMIKWIIILLIVAAAASLLGMPALAGAAATGARILIGIVLVIFLLIVLGVFAVT